MGVEWGGEGGGFSSVPRKIAGKWEGSRIEEPDPGSESQFLHLLAV